MYCVIEDSLKKSRDGVLHEVRVNVSVDYCINFINYILYCKMLKIMEQPSHSLHMIPAVICISQ